MRFGLPDREFCWRRVFGVGFAVAAVAMGLADLRALEPTTPLSRLGRQSWTMENGLPQNTVPVLMQSRSGFLWVGTELGLARFDGTGFRVLDHANTPGFPDAEIRSLLDAGNGGLWVGTSDGLVLWKDGRASIFTTKDGLPSDSIRGMAQTSDGTVWAWTEAGLARWDGTRFQAIAMDGNAPRGVISSIAVDATKTLWVGTASGVATIRDGRWQAPQQAGLNAGPGRVTADDAGDVWIATGAGLFRSSGGSLTTVSAHGVLPGDGVNFLRPLADGTVAVASKSQLVLVKNGQVTGQFTVSKQLPGSRIESLFADREGCLWVGTNRGLARIGVVKGAVKLQELPQTDPLMANAVVGFLEDREGDLWVGTESGGLHVLRDARFRHVGVSDGLSSDATTAIVEDGKGGFWIGTRDAGLTHLTDGRTTTLTTANGLASDVILALASGPNGDVWVGTPDGLSRISNGRVSSMTSADGLPDDFIRSLLAQPDGSVWIGTRRGLTHLNHGQFTTLTTKDGLGSNLVGALAETADGDLWIATLNGLSRSHAGKLRNYTTADGLSSNVITALEVTTGDRLWVGTQGEGLNLLVGDRFVALRAQDHSGQLPKAIHAVLGDGAGHLWLASDTGLTRADAAGLLRCTQGMPCRPEAVRFTTADGLRSRETSSNSHPTAVRARSGELWFTTPRGVVVVDPLHFAAIGGPPPVAIERFAVDDAELIPEAEGRTRIAAGHLRFQFDYAGLSFASPQKVRYVYTLEGFDHAWTDAGTRRTAYYTNIPPGKYRFLVRSSLGEGSPLDAASYADTEAALAFELLPHFYQTWWFRGLLIVGLGLLVLLAFRLVFRRRVLRVEREFGAVMGERNRIAREIHDTLAQGYVGISLQLEILGQLLRGGRTDAAAKHLTLTQDLVREGLDDARQSIWALRSQDSGEQTMPIRLRRIVEQAGEGGLSANLEVYGAYRALSADTEKEIMRIAQEAIQNVKKHSGARKVDVRLEYDERFVVVSVADDGKGFDTGTDAAEGHYGLTGMRERAKLIQGEIAIASAPGEGTTVTLRVQARNRTKPPGQPGAESAVEAARVRD